MSEPRDPLFDVGEAAAYCTVSVRTLYRAHKRGRIRFIKVEGSTRVRQSECDRYLRAAERAA